MSTKKLNKTQQLELMNTIIQNTVIDHLNLLKKDKADAMIEHLQAAMAATFAPKQGGGTSTKIDANGDVYCNYFETYIDPSEFAMKLSKPSKTTGERTEVYKANCIIAEQILRKIKTLKANVTKQVMENFRAKIIDAETMEKYLNNLDAATNEKFQDITEVPTITEVLNWHNREEAGYEEMMEEADANEAE